MGKQGFKDVNNDPYVYQELTGAHSAAMGIDNIGTPVWGIYTSTTPGAIPVGNSNIGIDMTANGSIYLGPNGSGNTVINNGDINMQAAGNIELAYSNAAGTQGFIKAGGVSLISTINSSNIFVGVGAGNTTLNLGTSMSNTALGALSFQAVTDGATNTALGYGTLSAVTTGNSNVAIGVNAGNQITTTSNNIFISHVGVAGDSGKIRIGTLGNQTSTFIQGIASVVVGNKEYVTIDTTTGEMGSDSGPASSGVTSLAGDSGGALTGALTLAGGNNITTSGAVATITIDVTGTTDHAIQLGNATGSLTSFGLGTATQVLQSGGAGADPAWSTATYPATSAQGDILYSSAANTIAGLAKDTNATRYLSNTGASNNPAWAQVDLSNGVTGVLPIANGGTNANTMATTYGVNYFDGTRIVTTAVGTATHVLTSNGAGVAPTFQAIPASGVTSIAGTANQITASAATGAVTLSTPSTFIAPGSIAATTTVASTTTMTAGTGFTVTTGNATITAGNILLPTTTTTTGQIQINSLRFLHNFGGIRNTFVGETAGNLTASGAQQNTGVGYQALLGLTSGDANVAIGDAALGSVSSGGNNIGIGSNACSSVTTNSQNTVIGDQAMLFGTGSTNTILGYRAANTASFSGSTNVVLGANSGTGMNGAHSSNIYISNAGAAESNTTRIGTQGTGSGQQSKAFVAGIYNTAVTAASTVVMADSSHQLGGTGVAAGTSLQLGAGAFTLTSTTGTIMSAATTGEITYPLQPAFLAYLGSDDLNKTGAGTAWTLGSSTALTEVFDQSGDFATSGTFTAPVTGRYFLTATMRIGGITVAMTNGTLTLTTSNRAMGWLINVGAVQVATNNVSLTATAFVDMDAADTATVSITISNGAGDTADIQGGSSMNTSFGGHLVC